MKDTKVYIIILTFLFSISVFAQYGSVGVKDARSVGLGKTHNAVSSGIFSIGINPANLSFNTQNTF